MLKFVAKKSLEQNDYIKFHTTSTNSQNSSQQDPLPEMGTSLPLKKATSLNSDWQKIEDQVMLWFATKDIRVGKPENIYLETIQAKKKQICLLSQKSQSKPDSLLGRRLGRSLTICL